MTTDIAQKARDEVFQKIGRNVVNFQRLEGLLKALLKSSRIHGNPENLKSRTEKQNSSIDMQSMGSLVGSVFDTVLSEKAMPEPPDDIEKAWVSFKFEIELDLEEKERLKLALTDLVDKRNSLIHQKLIRTDFNSIKSCRELGEELDTQRERLAPHYKRIHSLLKSRLNTQEQASKILNSDEFKNFLANL